MNINIANEKILASIAVTFYAFLDWYIFLVCKEFALCGLVIPSLEAPSLFILWLTGLLILKDILFIAVQFSFLLFTFVDIGIKEIFLMLLVLFLLMLCPFSSWSHSFSGIYHFRTRNSYILVDFQFYP